MPRPRSKAGKYENNKFEYINMDFDDRGKADVLAWIGARKVETDDAIMTMADAGFKVSIGLNKWSGMYTCALTCKDPERAIYNKCVGYEHTDVAQLIRIMLYVCTERLENPDAVITPAKETNDW